MKFVDMELENFLAISHAKVNLTDRGLVLIQGVNSDDSSADSNGAGKSTLADGIDWILYGETARGVSGDDVINIAAGKGTRGALRILDDDGLTYTIARHRKHKTGKNSLTVVASDGITETELTKGTDKLTQEVVLKIVGASHAVFKAAVYAGQEQMPDLPAMTDKHLKLLLEEAAGTEVLEAAYKTARTSLQAAQQALAAAEAYKNGLETGREFKRNEILSLTEKRGAWEVQRTNQLKELTNNVVTDIARVKAIDTALAKYDVPALQAKVAECDAQIAAVASEHTKLNELTIAVNEKLSNDQAITNQLNGLALTIAKTNKELDGVNHKVGCPCDSCGRPLTEAELDGVKGSIERTLADLVKQQEQLTVERSRIQAEASIAAQAVAAHKAAMTDVSVVQDYRRIANEALAEVSRLTFERAKVLELAQSTKKQIDQMKSAANPYEEAIAQATKEDFGLQGDIAKAEAAVKEAQLKVDLENEVVKVYSPAGVRAHILDEVTPFLNAQTSRYLTTLSDGNIDANWTTLVKNGKGELREKFSIEVENATGAKSFAGLSGGEKRKVRVATALALQDLVATRANKPIDLFMADEIDDALDAAGLERLMTILEEKARERGSVFVISHNNLKDWISNVVTVTKSGSSSVVTETTL